jgi:hypothetical protein
MEWNKNLCFPRTHHRTTHLMQVTSTKGQNSSKLCGYSLSNCNRSALFPLGITQTKARVCWKPKYYLPPCPFPVSLLPLLYLSLGQKKKRNLSAGLEPGILCSAHHRNKKEKKEICRRSRAGHPLLCQQASSRHPHHHSFFHQVLQLQTSGLCSVLPESIYISPAEPPAPGAPASAGWGPQQSAAQRPSAAPCFCTRRRTDRTRSPAMTDRHPARASRWPINTCHC